jgi:hypothetical protein
MNTVYPSGGGAADNDLLFEDLMFAGVQPWKTSELYFFVEPSTGVGGVAPPTHYLELNNRLIDEKCVAFGMHRSQVQNDGASVNASVKWWAEQSGQVAGVPLAELFVGFF